MVFQWVLLWALFLLIFLLGFMRNFSRFLKPYIYLCYMDDTFACFSLRNEALSFFHCLNDLHPFLTFTMDEEKDNKLPFFNALVKRHSITFVNFIYRKSVFSSLYLNWDTFVPKSKKVNLIKCLTFRTLKICLDNKIKSEFEQIKNLFFWVMGILRNSLLTPLTKLNMFSNNIRPLSLLNAQFMLDFLGLDFQASWLPIRFLPVIICQNRAMVQTIFTNQAAFLFIHKDVLPIFQQSNLIYKFQYICIGPTFQCLKVSVK